MLYKLTVVLDNDLSAGGNAFFKRRKTAPEHKSAKAESADGSHFPNDFVPAGLKL